MNPKLATNFGFFLYCYTKFNLLFREMDMKILLKIYRMLNEQLHRLLLSYIRQWHSIVIGRRESSVRCGYDTVKVMLEQDSFLTTSENVPECRVMWKYS